MSNNFNVLFNKTEKIINVYIILYSNIFFIYSLHLQIYQKIFIFCIKTIGIHHISEPIGMVQYKTGKPGLWNLLIRNKNQLINESTIVTALMNKT